MTFLLEYDRRAGRLIKMQEFLDRNRAEGARLQLELALNRAGIRHEVVLLEATDKQALRKTHRRYFATAAELADAARASVA